MQAQGSLFERLSGQAPARVSKADAEGVLTHSIALHLGKMLSTRAGSVQTLPDYGLPDLNDMRLSLHDSLQQARVSIERFIEAYEPRLSRVRVHTLPRAHDPLRLAFDIEAQLHMEGGLRPVRFSAQLDGSGQVRVS
ncbi:type VI secretion system baseplate subunit TssE [Atopomonas sediminilitoris]|uniref:type VI secretion system baseplate subunit TssE n=1 Tax=Atopomonas sediminilitoris TaxID=2919919 RepID=UPI001F4DA433|nr:type VI secretion system baseplate subunit TssE [Atopomonas sediminilitoris]MCJ8170460.1 type VI secretion system baseplate subunit TssE [Atopomonas sediminilitoris]